MRVALSYRLLLLFAAASPNARRVTASPAPFVVLVNMWLTTSANICNLGYVDKTDRPTQGVCQSDVSSTHGGTRFYTATCTDSTAASSWTIHSFLATTASCKTYDTSTVSGTGLQCSLLNNYQVSVDCSNAGINAAGLNGPLPTCTNTIDSTTVGGSGGSIPGSGSQFVLKSRAQCRAGQINQINNIAFSSTGGSSATIAQMQYALVYNSDTQAALSNSISAAYGSRVALASSLVWPALSTANCKRQNSGSNDCPTAAQNKQKQSIL